jgi:hypothetical protein
VSTGAASGGVNPPLFFSQEVVAKTTATKPNNGKSNFFIVNILKGRLISFSQPL